MNITLKRKSNLLPNARRWMNENLTWRLQSYTVFGYERMVNDLNSNTNQKMFQIIPREHNFDFHQRDRVVTFTFSHIFERSNAFKGNEETIVVLSACPVTPRFRDIRHSSYRHLMIRISLGLKSLPPLLSTMSKEFYKTSQIIRPCNEFLWRLIKWPRST
jgi:hypothetical protein